MNDIDAIRARHERCKPDWCIHREMDGTAGVGCDTMAVLAECDQQIRYLRSGDRVHHLIGYTAALEEVVARTGVIVDLKVDGQAEPQRYAGAEAVGVVRSMWDLLPVESKALDAARPIVWLPVEDETPSERKEEEG